MSIEPPYNVSAKWERPINNFRQAVDTLFAMSITFLGDHIIQDDFGIRETYGIDTPFDPIVESGSAFGNFLGGQLSDFGSVGTWYMFHHFALMGFGRMLPEGKVKDFAKNNLRNISIATTCLNGYLYEIFQVFYHGGSKVEALQDSMAYTAGALLLVGMSPFFDTIYTKIRDMKVDNQHSLRRRDNKV